MQATTLVDLLRQRATASPDRVAYDFVGEPRTFGQLWADVEQFAAALIERGVGRGDRVVLAIPNGHDFFTGFYGAQRAGAIAVPTFPLAPPARILEVARLCGARHVVAPSDTAPATLEQWRETAAPTRVLTPSEVASDPAEARLHEPGPDDIAFLQYTSGSTGDPKGVQLTHRMLLTNARQMIEGWAITAEDRFVSWLPTYHDMGLIIMTIVPFTVGASLFLLPTQVADTGPWLDCIEANRATFTGSPDFGYRVCLRHLERRRGEPIPDLTSLRVALNGAEPVRATTIEEFHETFGLSDVMIAAYGLAEATVGVATCAPSTRNRVDARGAVSAGRPFPEVVVRILDENDREVSPGRPGHIVVSSPANTTGYFQNETATEALFVDSETIRTGDIGYIDDDGLLYILSRAKDTIIQAGHTVYPQEVEEIANGLPGVRYAAAIGVDHGRVEGEQLTVLVEIRPDALSDDARKACVISITNGVAERFGFRPARVHLVAPKTIPLTHNGKLRRAELRRRYLDGSLRPSYLYPPTSGSPVAG